MLYIPVPYFIASNLEQYPKVIHWGSYAKMWAVFCFSGGMQLVRFMGLTASQLQYKYRHLGLTHENQMVEP